MAKHEWMAVDGGPGATICYMWCAHCGTLWRIADPHDPSRTNRYFLAGWALEKDASSRPEGGLPDEPECPPKAPRFEIMVSEPPPAAR
jgi:hypothetical protein